MAGKVTQSRFWAAPRGIRWVEVAMSIDKGSNGMPEIDVHKRTTKVNLSIVIGIALFFATMAIVIVWLWASHR